MCAVQSAMTWLSAKLVASSPRPFPHSAQKAPLDRSQMHRLPLQITGNRSDSRCISKDAALGSISRVRQPRAAPDNPGDRASPPRTRTREASRGAGQHGGISATPWTSPRRGRSPGSSRPDAGTKPPRPVRQPDVPAGRRARVSGAGRHVLHLDVHRRLRQAVQRHGDGSKVMRLLVIGRRSSCIS